MVRHEAGEALGAIGEHPQFDIIEILRSYINDPVCEVTSNEFCIGK